MLRQLRYTGMLETIRIRKEGYSVRMQFSDFIARYGVLTHDTGNKSTATPARCEAVLRAADAKGYLVGKTKIFLK